jgi:ketosteroid isomerase-like protein
MSGKLPVETVLAFLEQINARNVDGLCALMMEDHLFVDGLGNRMQGRESMRQGWAGYFRMFPDYRVSHTDIFSQADVVATFGSAEGTRDNFQRKTIGTRRRRGERWCVMA